MVWAPHNLYLDTGYGPLGEPRVRLFHYVFFPELLNGSNDGEDIGSLPSLHAGVY